MFGLVEERVDKLSQKDSLHSACHPKERPKGGLGDRVDDDCCQDGGNVGDGPPVQHVVLLLGDKRNLHVHHASSPKEHNDV